MKVRGLAHLGALASATVLTLGVAGAISAASVAPTFHEGNATEADCPAGTTGIKIAGGAPSGSAAGVTVTVTYHDNNTIDFAATGGLVAVAFVKGGDNANKYTYSPAVSSDTNLVSPLNSGETGPDGQPYGLLRRPGAAAAATQWQGCAAAAAQCSGKHPAQCPAVRCAQRQRRGRDQHAVRRRRRGRDGCPERTVH